MGEEAYIGLYPAWVYYWLDLDDEEIRLHNQAR